MKIGSKSDDDVGMGRPFGPHCAAGGAVREGSAAVRPIQGRQREELLFTLHTGRSILAR